MPSFPTRSSWTSLSSRFPPQLDQKGRQTFQKIRSVCPRWRSICLSSPVLWASISVTCEKGGKGNKLEYIRLLDGWLLRAGPSIPLGLQYTDPAASSMQDEDKAAIKALIWRYQPRWRSLSLFIESECFWSALFNPPPSNWISLRTLSLWTYDFLCVGAEKASKGYDALAKMSMLRCLSVEHHGVHGNTRQFGPSDLPELRITVDFFSIDQARLITSFHRLTTLVLVAASGHISILSLNEHLVLPSLLSFSYHAGDVSLLCHFITPALVYLAIKLYPEPELDYHSDGEILSGFLSRCTNALQSITLDTSSEELFVAKILPAIAIRQNLKHLALDIWPSKVAFLENLHDDWFPNLRNLAISIEVSEHGARSEALELERMQGLAMFLLRWTERGREALELLTIHKRSEVISFPYDLFEGIALGRLSVMVPWEN
ncbi:hypothetical protein BKA70DRAFT_48478 [Coprinopsis sp. MPI-PUGE-AT-0042]|nr:hypothetical protein BKA70DRAFT_48478 [Coprinopsis sp. MPI-PUGE-AT-0042]